MKINYRQLSILVFLSFITTKMSALPGFLYLDAGNMGWLIALIYMFNDGVFALLIVNLMRKSGNKNILEFLNYTLGPVLARIVLLIFMLKFLIDIAIIGNGMEFFVTENLYENYVWFKFGIPLILISGFMVYKGVRNIGRVAEFFWLLILFVCLYIALKTIANVNVLEFLPMFKDGLTPLVQNSWKHVNWFGSSTFLFILFGCVDFKEKKKVKLTLFILLAIGLVMLVYFVFYGLYGKVGSLHQFAISDIAQYNNNNSSIGEINWLIVSVWIVAQIIQFSLYGYCFVKSFMYLFNIKKTYWGVLALSAYIIFWGVYNEIVLDAEFILFTFASSVISMLASYVLPNFIIIGYLVRKRKEKEGVKHEKVQVNIQS